MEITVGRIIRIAGGVDRVADATRASRRPVTFEAVYKWPKYGIPEHHWRAVMGLCEGRIGPVELHHANEAARAGVRD